MTGPDGVRSAATARRGRVLVVVSLVALLAASGTSLGDASVPARAVMIMVVCRQGWIVEFHPDGRAHAQWGSLPGDGASVPTGTVDFGRLLETLERLRVETRVEGGLQVAIHRRGETSATAFHVSDAAPLRSLIASLRDKWRQDAGGARFHELVRRQPICP
jgi:hypothetical protein